METKSFEISKDEYKSLSKEDREYYTAVKQYETSHTKIWCDMVGNSYRGLNKRIVYRVKSYVEYTNDIRDAFENNDIEWAYRILCKVSSDLDISRKLANSLIKTIASKL